MITNEQIDSFIEKIPPSPEALRNTLMLLDQGELIKAASVAKSDPALQSYLKNMVNKPIFGFQNEVSEISQIFGILGVSGSQQAVYNYMMSLLSPKKWFFFKLNANTFYELQAKLSKRWKDILINLKIENKDIESAITLLPASIIVAEALFKDNIKDVELLRSTHEIDLNTILKRLCNQDLFDICGRIAKKWDMPETVSQIVHCASGSSPSQDTQINTLGKWMHLLLFYELSLPMFINAGLNDFIEFHIEYVGDIYDDFSILTGIQ